MHNLKEIRKDFSKFEKSLEQRSIKIDFINLQILLSKTTVRHPIGQCHLMSSKVSSFGEFIIFLIDLSSLCS